MKEPKPMPKSASPAVPMPKPASPADPMPKPASPAGPIVKRMPIKLGPLHPMDMQALAKIPRAFGQRNYIPSTFTLPKQGFQGFPGINLGEVFMMLAQRAAQPPPTTQTTVNITNVTVGGSSSGSAGSSGILDTIAALFLFFMRFRSHDVFSGKFWYPDIFPFCLFLQETTFVS